MTEESAPTLSSLAGVLLDTPTGGSAWGTAVVAMFFAVVVVLIGSAMATNNDRSWLPMTVMAGFIAKLIGSTARFLVLQVEYGGKGDASGYHAAGLALSTVWRSFQVPSNVERIGTDVVQAITGLLYVPYQPSKLGGFFIFASLSFFGQMLLYAAFRHSFPNHHLKWYAVAVFFSPNLLYWPSSIGKDSLMLLSIGITAYGISRLLSGYNTAWAALVAVGLGGAATIRAHMSLLLAGGLFVALIFAKAPRIRAAQIRRFTLLVGAGASLALVITFTAQSFGVDLAAAASLEAATDEVEGVFEGVEKQTGQGGSAVTGATISSPADFPEAFLRVIFRPLPHEANTPLYAFASLEGSILLLILVFRLPWILRNLFKVRRYPYLVFALAYTGGFIVAFSSILNLGIMARQRSQVMPFFLALLVVLSRKRIEEGTEANAEPEPELAAPRELAVAHSSRDARSLE